MLEAGLSAEREKQGQAPVKRPVKAKTDAMDAMQGILQRMNRSRTALRRYLSEVEASAPGPTVRPPSELIELPIPQTAPAPAPAPEPEREREPAPAEPTPEMSLPPSMARRMARFGPAHPSSPATAKTRAQEVVAAGAMDKDIGSLGSVAVAAIRASERQASSEGRTWSVGHILRSHMRDVMSVAWVEASKGTLLVSGGLDATVKVWAISSRSQNDLEPVATFRGHTAGIVTVAVVGRSVYSADIKGVVRVWDLTMPPTPYPPRADHSARAVAELYAHDDAIWSICSTLDRIVTVSADGTAKIWGMADLEVPAQPAPLAVIHGRFTVAAVSSMTDQLYIGSPTGVTAYSAYGEPTGLEINVGHVVSLAAHPLRPVLAIGTEERVFIADLNTGEVTKDFRPHEGRLASLRFSSNGMFLTTAGHSQSIRMWSCEDWSCASDVSAHRKNWDDAIHCVAISPDDGLVATAGADGQVVVLH